MILTEQGPMDLKTFKNKEVGRTSNELEEGLIFPNKALTSSIETELKESKMDGLEELLVRGLGKGEMFALTFTTLSIKYLRVLLQLLLEKIGKFRVCSVQSCIKQDFRISLARRY